MKIGNNIKVIRENEKNLKQEDVAKSLGISLKAYSNIENNVSDITLTRLFELAEIFDCTPEYILNYQEKPTFTNHFNNYEGNHGVNIMYQGFTPEQIKNLEKQLHASEQKANALKNTMRSSKN